jgi:hypothetical protein
MAYSAAPGRTTSGVWRCVALQVLREMEVPNFPTYLPIQPKPEPDDGATDRCIYLHGSPTQRVGAALRTLPDLLDRPPDHSELRGRPCIADFHRAYLSGTCLPPLSSIEPRLPLLVLDWQPHVPTD